MIRRITAPERIRTVDPVLTWRVTLNEPPSCAWRRRFLDLAYAPGLFFDSGIRIDDATMIFEREPAGLLAGLERIDAWIGQAKGADGPRAHEEGRDGHQLNGKHASPRGRAHRRGGDAAGLDPEAPRRQRQLARVRRGGRQGVGGATRRDRHAPGRDPAASDRAGGDDRDPEPGRERSEPARRDRHETPR